MHKIKHDKNQRQKRQLRVRSKLHGTAKRPRLSIFRSNHHIYAQVINDEQGVTLLTSCDLGKTNKKSGSKTDSAQQVAKELLTQLTKKKISKLVFDRGYYKYHGRVKAIAETLRVGGIEI